MSRELVGTWVITLRKWLGKVWDIFPDLPAFFAIAIVSTFRFKGLFATLAGYFIRRLFRLCWFSWTLFNNAILRNIKMQIVEADFTGISLGIFRVKSTSALFAVFSWPFFFQLFLFLFLLYPIFSLWFCCFSHGFSCGENLMTNQKPARGMRSWHWLPDSWGRYGCKCRLREIRRHTWDRLFLSFYVFFLPCLLL